VQLYIFILDDSKFGSRIILQTLLQSRTPLTFLITHTSVRKMRCLFLWLFRATQCTGKEIEGIGCQRTLFNHRIIMVEALLFFYNHRSYVHLNSPCIFPVQPCDCIACTATFTVLYMQLHGYDWSLFVALNISHVCYSIVAWRTNEDHI
jgi:hypothetical protein